MTKILFFLIIFTITGSSNSYAQDVEIAMKCSEVYGLSPQTEDFQLCAKWVAEQVIPASRNNLIRVEPFASFACRIIGTQEGSAKHASCLSLKSLVADKMWQSAQNHARNSKAPDNSPKITDCSTNRVGSTMDTTCMQW